MKTIRNVLFASMLVFAFSCEKDSDVTGIEDADSVSLRQADFESVMDVVDSGIDMEAYRKSLPEVEFETPKGFQNDKVKIEINPNNVQSRVAGLCTVDFENANISPGGVVGFDSPLDATTDNGFFSPGDIAEGVYFDTTGSSSGALALIGPGFNGNSDTQLAANFFAESFNIYFITPVSYVEFSVVSHFNDGPVDIFIDDIIVGTLSGTNEGSSVAISGPGFNKITLNSQTNQAEGIGYLIFSCVQDKDGDGVNDDDDNCPDTYNPDQANNDGDAEGDACDPDDDNDGVLDVDDNCQFTFNPDQANYDGDSEGDICDDDDDNDGCPDDEDPHPFSNQSQTVVIGGCDTGVPNQALGCSTMADLLMDCCLYSGSRNAYVVCVYRTLQDWLRAGIINRAQQTAIYSCAVRNYYSCNNYNNGSQ